MDACMKSGSCARPVRLPMHTNTSQDHAVMDDKIFDLHFVNGPLHGQIVLQREIDAVGIWHVGGVYRYSPYAETYTWREISRHVR